MNPSEIAKMMLKWEEMQRECDRLKAQIENEVLVSGKSFKIGVIACTVYGERKEFDYAKAGTPQKYLDLHATTTYDYKAAYDEWKADDLEAPDAPFKRILAPRAILKLEKEKEP